MLFAIPKGPQKLARGKPPSPLDHFSLLSGTFAIGLAANGGFSVHTCRFQWGQRTPSSCRSRAFHQIRASGCEGTSGAARDTGIRPITPDGEISLAGDHPPLTGQREEVCSSGLTPVALSALPKLWLSALLLKRRTSSVWCYWGDITGEVGACGHFPTGRAQRGWCVI